MLRSHGAALAILPRAEYAWAYDEFNRLENATERFNNDSATDRGITHTYDHNGQLASTIVDLPSPTPNVETYYTYDANGNRTSGQTADADNYNRVLSDATYSYRYDDEGNQIARMRKDDGTREAFAWDHRNRLTSIATQLPREVAHWKFDGDATNATGNSDLDGTLVNGATYCSTASCGDDPIPAAGGGDFLVLDGDDAYVSMGNHDELKIRDHDLSLSAWFQVVDEDRYMVILKQGNPFNAGGAGYRIAWRGEQATPRMEFIVNDGVDQGGSADYLLLKEDYPGGDGIVDGEWHHVVVTFTNSNGGTVKMYIDGVEVDSKSNTQYGDIVGTSNFYVGTQQGVAPGYFERYIDDVRLWHQVLDADDVAALYGSADPLYESNTAAYVKNTKIVDYTYDAFDRRVLKEIDGNGDRDMADAGDEAHQYVYDGQDIVLAFDKDAALTNRYLHGPAVDQILADEQYTGGASPANTAGTTYWALADNLGSVRQLVTNLGEEVYRALFDGFGVMTVVVGATIEHIYGFTGREIDAESHLQHNRARYYDAALGRWISEDPIGMQDDENTHRYVKNSPTNATDPSGMAGFWSRAWNVIKKVAKKVVDGVVNAVKEVAKRIENFVKNPVQAIKQEIVQKVMQPVEAVRSVIYAYESYEAYRDCMVNGKRDKAEAVAVAIVMVVGDETGMMSLMEGVFGTEVYVDADGNIQGRDLTDDEADDKIADGLIATAGTGAAIYGAGKAAGGALARGKGIPKPPRCHPDTPDKCFTSETLVVMAAFEPTVVLAGIAVGQPTDDSLTWCLLVATGIALAQAMRERRAGLREKPRRGRRDRFGFFGDDGDEETDEDEPRNESDAPPFAPRRSVPQAAIDGGAVDALCDRAAGRENVTLSAVDGAIAKSTYSGSRVKANRCRQPESANRDIEVRLVARDSERTTKQRPTAISRRNCSRWWLATAVCLALGVFWSRGDVPLDAQARLSTPGSTANGSQPRRLLKRIADVEVGERVIADAERGEGDDAAGEVDRATWGKVTFAARKADGERADVVLLRPVSWIVARDVRVGTTIPLSVKECGIDGPAKVISVEPCPQILSGEGRVVTGTFRHAAGRILNVSIEGVDEPIGTTATHPFWSEDRRDFVPAERLRVGEFVRTLDSLRRVTALNWRPADEPVYNLEVHVDHVYHVSASGVLVHNGCGSYTNTHESGKRYHGKGGEDRPAESGKKIADRENDPLVKTDWEPAANDREAFKAEDRRIQADGEGVKNPDNYNKINSPGHKYRQQDGEL